MTPSDKNIPPHSIESEQALLGGLMMDNRAWDEIADIINRYDFYSPKNQLIFQAIASIIDSRQAADIITVNTYLNEHNQLNNAGGAPYLTELNINAPSSTNIKAYAKQVREDSIKRALLYSSTDINNKVHKKDGSSAREILDFAEQKIFNISENVDKQKNSSIHIKEGLKSVRQTAEKITRDGIQSVQTGFSDLDRLTSGFHNGDLIIIAGRPSMGKTSFTMNIVEHIAIHSSNKKPVMVFSLEMSNEQILTRLIASYGRIDSKKIRSGKMDEGDWHKFNNTIAELDKGDIIIDETVSITPLEVRAKCRRIKRAYPNLAMIIIDYLQLMNKADTNQNVTSENRNQEISQISRSLKALARELSIPIVVLSQLNRAVEGRSKERKGRTPQMADLRDSGAIEQDADMIIFIYRDEVYHDREKNGYGSDIEKGMADIILAKNRNGPIGTLRLKFEQEFTKFSNYIRTSKNDHLLEHADEGYINKQDNFSDDISDEDYSAASKAIDDDPF